MSPPAESIVLIAGSLIMVIRSFEEIEFDICHYATKQVMVKDQVTNGKRGEHLRHRLRIRRVIGTYLDLHALLNRLVVKADTPSAWSKDGIHNAFWTRLLRMVYGDTAMNAALDGRAAIDVDTELRQLKETKSHNSTKYELKLRGALSVLDPRTLGEFLKRCIADPDRVFPGHVRKLGWEHDCLRHYLTPRWSDSEDGRALAYEYELGTHGHSCADSVALASRSVQPLAATKPFAGKRKVNDGGAAGAAAKPKKPRNSATIQLAPAPALAMPVQVPPMIQCKYHPNLVPVVPALPMLAQEPPLIGCEQPPTNDRSPPSLMHRLEDEEGDTRTEGVVGKGSEETEEDVDSEGDFDGDSGKLAVQAAAADAIKELAPLSSANLLLQVVVAMNHADADAAQDALCKLFERAPSGRSNFGTIVHDALSQLRERHVSAPVPEPTSGGGSGSGHLSSPASDGSGSGSGCFDSCFDMDILYDVFKSQGDALQTDHSDLDITFDDALDLKIF
mmetsp:Transcript_9673/g.23887  ORF Transcript_9673/g.23887 Transcript_9673/m.23887 type:complete len:504 (-) Transcript_9673:1032-2543(-)